MENLFLKRLKGISTLIIVFLLLIFILAGKNGFQNINWFFVIGLSIFCYCCDEYELKKGKSEKDKRGMFKKSETKGFILGIVVSFILDLLAVNDLATRIIILAIIALILYLLRYYFIRAKTN